jgi:hypothetical protein
MRFLSTEEKIRCGYHCCRALRAWFQDEENTIHLVIGLNRDNIASLQRGEVFTLSGGEGYVLSENSDVVLL